MMKPHSPRQLMILPAMDLRILNLVARRAAIAPFLDRTLGAGLALGAIEWKGKLSRLLRARLRGLRVSKMA